MTDFSFKDEEKPVAPKKIAAPELTAPSPPLPPTAQPVVESAPSPSPPSAPSPQVTLPSPSTATKSTRKTAEARPNSEGVQTAKLPAVTTPGIAPTPTAQEKPTAETPEITDPAKRDPEFRGKPAKGGRAASGGLSSNWDTVLNWLTPFAFWILRGAALFGGLAISYLLWGIFSGGMQGPSGNAAQTVQNVKMAIVILNWSLLGVALSCMILLWEEKFVAFVTVGLGVLFYFGAAPLLRMAGDSRTIQEAAVALQRGALPLLALGGLKCAYDIVQWIVELPNRMRNNASVGVAQRAEPRQQREAKNATMFSPCWKLPFCREVIRKQCPAYLARRTCWKFGRGCYCDEEMISRIIRGESLENIKAPTRMSRQKKPPCGRCYIFLEHQGLKYKAVSPIAIPATLGIMYFGWDTYLALTNRLADSFGFFWNKLAFQTADTAVKVVNSAGKELEAAPSTLSPEQIQHTAQTMFGVLLGFALLIYMSKAIEWAIYKAKL